jgi:hypothetical protein
VSYVLEEESFDRPLGQFEGFAARGKGETTNDGQMEVKRTRKGRIALHIFGSNSANNSG